MVRPQPKPLQVCFFTYIASARVWGGTGLVMADVQSLWHAEENEDQNDTVKYCCQFEDPAPAQVLANKTTDDWR
jgi:hypothetical protein